jgi:broad specificity phosphatase PhoE
VHFVRHAEGFHNAANAAMGNDEPSTCAEAGGLDTERKLWDARLTDKGKSQCQSLHQELDKKRSEGTWHDPELIVVSPLTRTLETALLCFGPATEDGTPWLVHELCRERWGKYTCDGRRPISEIRQEFPSCIDFDSHCHVENDESWTPERESDEHCHERGLRFVKWLCARPEQNIVVVSHSSFLKHVFALFGHGTREADKDKLHRVAGNCELRSVVIVDHDLGPMQHTVTFE